MTDKKQTNTSRRSFFLRGGGALGAGLVSAAAGAGTLVFDAGSPLKEQLARLQQRLVTMENREAIRLLQQAYTHLLEIQAYDAVVELFSDEAAVEFYDESYQGKQQGIRELYVEACAQQQIPRLHTAFRYDPTQQQDEIVISEDLQSATAAFHVQVEVSEPCTDTTVLGAMARQQGLPASRRWERGRYDLECSRISGQWKISRLAYRPLTRRTVSIT